MMTAMTAGARDLRPWSRVRNDPGSVAWLLVGVAVGVVSAVIARVAPWPISSLPHYAAPYVLLLVLIGETASAPLAAVLRAIVCFLAFVVAYYLVVLVQFGAVPVLYAGAWVIAALTVCPSAAAAVRWARSKGGPGAAVVAAVAGAVALSDGAVGNAVRVLVGRGDGAFVQPALAAADLLVAAVAVAVLSGAGRTRLLSLALLVPFAVIATYAGWIVHFGTGPYL